MGKPKGERSKNQPSSSSLAASLLPSGASAVGFGGYLGSSRIEPSTSSEESASFLDVDSEVAQHLKRLGRKDPTTKLKALASLCLLFKKKSGEEIVQIVPQWAFEYKRLLLDYNREVRRATHDAMTSLVITVRKGLAPHLKSLMGPWWFSLFDPILEVSQAAKRSLEAAFPASERRLDALMLCVNEIFLYLDENLKLTPQAMSDKATPMDELEDMHQRVISSSLLAIATLVDILPGMKFQSQDSKTITTEQKLASKARLTTISSAEKMFSEHNFFLEFFKSKTPVIRSATYSVLTSFIRHLPHAFNEGNMKTISGSILGVFQDKDASCHSSMWDMLFVFSRKFPDCWSYSNIQNVALSRFWNFLRQGCYGSQQISYPALVLFLESVSLTTIGGEQFILNFFQNLWAGRNPLHSSAADGLAFFKAFRECFLWALGNASRYHKCGDAVNPLPIKLISNILVELLWQDYLLPVNLKHKDESLSQRSNGSSEEGINPSDERSTGTHCASYPLSYAEELGKCVVQILADISNKESNLLSVFCTSFHKDCLEIFQKDVYHPKIHEHVEQISNFFRLLDQFVWQKGQTWPLRYLAGPLFANSFKVIKTMDSPDTVRFLSVLVEIFGPVTLFSCLRFCEEDLWATSCIDDVNNEIKTKFFLEAFRDDFVPWCLDRRACSSNEKLDLLISSVQDEFFSEQWCFIITYATGLDKWSETDINTSDVIDQTKVLTVLTEKVKEKVKKMKIKNAHTVGYLLEHWQHKLLDSAAVTVALHSPTSIYSAMFLRSVLGGSIEDDQTCLLSGEAVITIFEEILKKLIAFLSSSSFEWAKNSTSLMLSRSIDLMQNQNSSFSDRLKMAQFAFEVLEGSICCSNMLVEDFMLLPSILAAIFIIDWECIMSSCLSENHSYESSKNWIDLDSSIATSETALDDCLREHFDAKLMLGRRMHAFRHKISVSFWKSLNSNNLSMLRNILVQTLRSAVFETNSIGSERISFLCCEWVLDLLELTCDDPVELHTMLDQLLSEDSSWPSWVAPLLQDESRSATIRVKRVHIGIDEARHNQFIAFVEKLNSSLGFDKVIAGFVSQSPFTSAVSLTEHTASFSSSYSREWLAAELLCTWKWQGGNALDSFLPSLSKYAVYESSHPEAHVIFSIINILLDGILVHGVSSLWISFNTWIASVDEVNNVQDPFLRALTFLLLTLFVKDKVWRKPEAVELFENVVNRLFIDTTVNRTCLKILPFVVSVVIEPLLIQSSEFGDSSKDVLLAHWKDDSVLKNVLSWLQRALSFPPLGITHGESDLEDWVQLIISCYPLRITCVPGTCQVEVVRNISHVEKTMLLSLFQKQRSGNVSTAVLEMSSAASSSQMILAKLTALSVGYCWKEFSEDDWHFVLDNVLRWIESSVLLIEEMTEKIDELMMSYTSKANFELVAEKLELVVQALDPFNINISGTALLILSLFSQLVQLQVEDSVEALQSIGLGRWAEIKDRVMENILRLFLSTGVAEAIASSSSDEASTMVASSRITYSRFWGQVASFVMNSPNHVRNTAMKSMELWGLSKGSISSLYALLFTSKPIASLQIAAYRLISTEPLCHLSILKENGLNCLEGNASVCEDSNLNNFESSSEDLFSLMDEISILIQKPAAELLKMDLATQDRVNVFLAWAILLSYLHLLPPSSSTRETLVQYVQESVGSAILDCIFQNIPLKQGVINVKKKDAGLISEASTAASAAKRVISTGSVLLSLETIWPIGTDQMASLAGAIYGMMIWLLPSYVSNWFTTLRDRALASTIESFTKEWCSPSLVSNELSQVKETVVVDENFSVSVNKSAYEIIATYKKEETGMDLVIRLPSCYPLRPVDVDCTRSLGISEVKKRKWLLSLTAFIRNQNGAIGEAIRIWKNNLDKEFLGVEECPICYSIIHTTNHSLPRLACKTCKHKFHSACLYKWFSTSHKSTCPLCQTPF